MRPCANQSAPAGLETAPSDRLAAPQRRSLARLGVLAPTPITLRPAGLGTALFGQICCSSAPVASRLGVLAPMPISLRLRLDFLGAQCKMTASAFSSPMRSFLRYDVLHVVSHGVLTLAHRTRPPSMVFMSAARGTAISAGGLSALLFPLLAFIIGHRCKLVKHFHE